MAAIVMAVGNHREGKRPGVGRLSSADGCTFERLSTVNPNPVGTEQGWAPVQRMIRKTFLCKHRLHRSNLAHRLAFESVTTLGLLRFFNQLAVFALFVAALSFSSNQEATRGILKTLRAEFDFEGMAAVSRREKFVQESMQTIGSKSKEFFILSSRYYDAQGKGNTQLIREIETFSASKLGLSINLKGVEFSFSAWAKIVPQYVSGYILRKRAVVEGAASKLACWGWFLSATAGPQFHYGCHDFFQSDSTAAQVEVGLETPVPMEPEKFVLLTMIVKEDKVLFYRNIDLLGAADLPRPVTDCFNAGEGLLIGDGGMDLGVVRFHPQALSLSSIEELFAGGSTLADISTGSTPAEGDPEGLKSTERSLSVSISGVREAVAGRQDASEVMMVLKTITETLASPPPPVPGSPAPPSIAPMGEIPASTVSVPDPATGRDYFSLIFGPHRLSPTNEESEHRFISNVPDFAGTGMTLSFWYRHVSCSKSTCGLYLLAVRDSERLCYTLWLETVAVWFDNVLGTPKYQYPNNFVDPKFELNDDINWRHITMVFDEKTDQVRYYLDGTLAFELPWGSAVKEADCNAAGKYMTLGRLGPADFTYGGDVDIYDMRMYVHTDGPLTHEDAMAISTASTPELDKDQKCLAIDAPAMADYSWADKFGHDCEWFFNNKDDFPALCELPDARTQCPIACASRQECLDTAEEPPLYVTWDRIRLVESRGESGTLCLSGGLTSDQVVEECKTWISERKAQYGDLSARSLDFLAWADSMDVTINRRGRRVNITSCEELLESIDEMCSFDEEAVKNFTKDVVANGGDYTIAFWIRPTGDQSKIPSFGNFYPHVQFLSSISPPQHNLASGLWANPFGEVRLYSACDTGERDIYENVEMSAADNEGWTMIAISRKNAHDDLNMTGSTMTVTNIGLNQESSLLKQCLYDETMMFKAIEINYPSLISPIMMIPKALPLAKIQQQYFQTADGIRTRAGPVVSNRQQVEDSEIKIDKLDYGPRSILMAPPIIFQTRNEPAKDCPFSYSTTLIKDEFAKMLNFKCRAPYEGSDEVLADSSLMYACPGDSVTNKKSSYFGLELSEVNGQKGYADFLYTVTDHPILSRDGSLLYTDSFIDSRTEMAQVILVFFTPNTGTTSVLTITADFSSFAAAEVSVSLLHYEILEGTSKWLYLIMQVIVMINLAIMFCDIFIISKALIVSSIKDRTMPSAVEIVKQIIDFGTVAMCVAFIVMRIPAKFATAPETERIVGGMSRIPWQSLDMALADKKKAFFDLSGDLLSLIDTQQAQNKFCNVILIISLLRVIQCTSLHPRLALLTGTIEKSFDDIWHSCILVVLLMGCFAGVATWRFGSTRDDFGNFELSMQTQFEMLFGEFPDEWSESRDMQAYTVLYIMIMFLLIQNFLLAIIVEAYMKVREHIGQSKIRQEVTADVISCLKAYGVSIYHGWPTPGKMGQVIGDWKAKLSVGFTEIYATGLFKSQAQAAKWLDFYGRFEFLAADVVEPFGPEPESSLEDRIESRVARVMGKEVQLKQFALEQLLVSKVSISKTPGAKKSSNDSGSGGSRAHGMNLPKDSSPITTVRGDLVHSDGLGKRMVERKNKNPPTTAEPLPAIDAGAAGGQQLLHLDILRSDRLAQENDVKTEAKLNSLQTEMSMLKQHMAKLQEESARQAALGAALSEGIQSRTPEAPEQAAGDAGSSGLGGLGLGGLWLFSE